MDTTISSQTPRPKALHIALWVAQVVLALMFIMAGFMKLSQPIDQLSKSLPWVTQAPVALVRFIGIAELLGGIGLILPAALRIKPALSGWAGAGIALIMLFATVFHISRGEYKAIGMTIVIGLLALFVAWGRLKRAPIYSK